MAKPLSKPCDRNICQTLKLVEKMIALADSGDAAREDIGCGVLYGYLRDSAYKLKKMAQKEKRAHIRKGWWQPEKDAGAETEPPARPPGENA